MARRSRDQTFRKSDIVRALKAAQAAGIPHPRIEIDTVRRVISIVPGELRKDDGAGNTAIPADGPVTPDDLRKLI